MRVLLLNPPSPPGLNVNRHFVGGFGSATHSRRARYGHDVLVVPPVFSAYAATMLEKSGFEPSILDGQVRDLDLPQLLREVEKRDPEVVVSRISLPSFEGDLRIVASIRGVLPDAFLIGWGTICTTEPQETLINSELDLVIRSELEFTLPEVIEKLEKKGSMHSVKGISLRSEGKIVHNRSRPFIKDLDALPLPAYHLLDVDKYVISRSRFFPEAPGKGFIRFFSAVSSRGCSFNCSYCGHPIAFGPWRAMSPERTVDEIEYLVNNYGVQGLWFLDAAFSINIERAKRICDEILGRGLNIRWICQTRREKLPRDLVKKMKKTGCVWIQIGVETGDPRLLRIKQGSTVNKTEEVFGILREEGILRWAYVMVGLPGESWETVKNTRKLINSISPDDIWVSIVTPYPGTELYETAKQNNWLITRDWKKYTLVDPVMSLPGFSDKDMKRARDYLQDRARIKEVVTAFRELRFKRVAKNVGRTILHFPSACKHFYNLIRCGLK